MITLLFWCVLNGFLFHFAPSVITENTKILIHVICIASDLNLITTLLNRKWRMNMKFSYKPVNPFQNDGLSSEDRTMLDAMRNTAYICGYRGEDVEYAVHQALKRIDRYDLLPTCEQESEE